MLPVVSVNVVRDQRVEFWHRLLGNYDVQQGLLSGSLVFLIQEDIVLRERMISFQIIQAGFCLS